MQDWIYCKDKLPPERKECIIYFTVFDNNEQKMNYLTGFGVYMNHTWFWLNPRDWKICRWCCIPSFQTIAWIPLPDPPQLKP